MLDADARIIKNIYLSSLRFLVPLTPEETYAAILQEVIKLVDGDFGNLVLFKDGKLMKVYSSIPSGYNIKFRKTGFTYQAFKYREVLIKDISEFKQSHVDLKQMGVKWCLFIPLSYQKQALGTISINSSKDKKPSKQLLQGLELFGSMTSLAIRKAHTHKENQEALKLRDSFIALAAHELRTPTTTILGYAQLLNKKASSFNKSEANWISDMYFESSRLSMLVKDLMEISRIRTNKLNLDLKICSLQEIIQKVISFFHFNFPKRKIFFISKLGKNKDLVIGDVTKLMQVFMNILDNAVKFSSDETKIILSLKYQKSYLIISFRDFGRGISKEELPKIFNDFYQGQNLSPEGMGLGLFLCKNIIEKHRGDILVQSKLNKGTEVKIRLPKAKYETRKKIK